MGSDRPAALYARVSTGNQDAERQVNECIALLENQGYARNQIEQYIEAPSSGADNQREKYQEMMAAIEDGAHDILAVTELSRLTRTGAEEALRVISTCLENDTAIHFTQTPLKLRTDDDAMTEAINRVLTVLLAELAKVEREQMIERIESGIKAAQEAGTWTSRSTPRGFYLDEGPEKGRLRVDVEEYLDTRRAVERVVTEGESKRSVAESTGIPRSSLTRYCNDEKYRDLYLAGEAWDPRLDAALAEQALEVNNG
jgi:DNA invertase Pin-like site-specific DNA recombinase